MASLEIKKYPDKILRKNCNSVKKVTEKESKLLEQMLVIMRQFSGIGLAAPQIGIPLQLIVADIGKGAIQLADPEIIKLKGTDTMVEGCLSVPGFTYEIERPYEAIVRGLDEKGSPKEIKASGLLARVLQHEIDHLQGKLIIDYQPFFKKLKFTCKNWWNVLNSK